MSTFQFAAEYNYRDFTFEGIAQLRDKLKQTAFFPGYNYKTPARNTAESLEPRVYGRDSEGNLHYIGCVID